MNAGQTQTAVRSVTKNLAKKSSFCTDRGEVIYKFTSAITAACEASFQVLIPGKSVSKERSVPWWNNELTTFRKKALAMRRRYERTRNNADLGKRESYSTRKLTGRTRPKYVRRN